MTRNSLLQEITAKEKISAILNRSVPVLMGIYIFFNPFPHTTAIKEICFYSTAGIVILLIFLKKADFSFKSPITLPFVLFVIWVFIGLFSALDQENSIHDFFKHLLKYLVIYYILINFFNSKKRFEILSWIIIISASIFSIGSIGYFYKILGHSASERMGFAGIAAINNIGFITLPAMLLSLNFFIKENKLHSKVILLICLSVTLTASLLTQTLGTLIGIIISFLVLFTKNKKALIVFSLLLVILLGVMPVKNRITSDNIQNRFKLKNVERVKIWHTYFQIIKDHPIKGLGFGMLTYTDKEMLDKYKQYKAKAPDKYRPSRFHPPHNMLIDITVRLGFVGLALFLYILSMLIYVGYRMIKHGKDNFIRKWALCLLAVMVAFLIQSIFVDILYHVYLIILYTIFAMTTILWRINVQPDSTILQKTITS